MKVSLNWLRSYIDTEFNAEEIAHRLTMAGLEVEELIPVRAVFSGVLIGEVLSVHQHPNADKLSLCQVNIGSETLPIVCGAPNVREGIFVPVAVIGGHVGEMEIKEVKIRGEVSRGMICSERELGLSERHDGILILDTDSKLGEIFMPQCQVSDYMLEINITPNRPDCMSHLGIARELAVIQSQEFIKPDDTVPETSGPAKDIIHIEIRDAEACPRYSARVIRNVKITSSPDWLRKRLESVGIRSINNIVDITNFILMETGHPLHAFDYKHIQDQKIIVRKALKNEIFTTLDEVDRTLTGDDLLICDGKRPVALAGIMGGRNSEVTAETSDILLESAYFNPMMIRKTAKRLGMSTEASQRFERGADPEGTLYALNRAVQFMVEMTAGTVCSEIMDAYPQKIESRTIELREKRVTHVLGAEIPHQKIVKILHCLGCIVDSSREYFNVTVPTFRPDLQNEIDLIEEIVRHYGFDKIPGRNNNTISLDEIQSHAINQIEKIRDIFSGMGFTEVLNTSLVSEKMTAVLTPETTPVRLKNPLSPESQFLRTSGLAGLLNNIEWNLNRNQKNLRLFEIAKIFRQNKGQRPAERSVCAAAMTGMQIPNTFWGKKAEPIHYFDLKGVLTAILKQFHLPGIDLRPDDSNDAFGDSALAVYSESSLLGWAGEIQPSILEELDIDQAVFAFELDADLFLDKIPAQIKYQDIPRFPSIKRDLAVVVDEIIPVDRLLKSIYKAGGGFVANVEVFDLYRGKPLKDNQKSVAFALTFMSMDRTLREEEIHPFMDKIIQILSNEHRAVLRS